MSGLEIILKMNNIESIEKEMKFDTGNNRGDERILILQPYTDFFLAAMTVGSFVDNFFDCSAHQTWFRASRIFFRALIGHCTMTMKFGEEEIIHFDTNKMFGLVK